jgi:2-methylcitrate dehydratase PrpD
MGDDSATVDGIDAAALVARLAPRWSAAIPAAVAARTRLAIADFVGAAMAGGMEPEQVALRTRLLTGDACCGRCTAIGHDVGVDASTAAFLNASACTACELDDRLPEARSHPAAHVIPVALALAEADDASGAHFVRAVTLGYEAASLLSELFYDRPDWIHPHAYWSAAAAAVAGAALRRFDIARLADLVNSALLFSPRLPFAAAWEGATVRNVYAGFGALTAMRCLECAEAGLTAPVGALQFVRERVGGAQLPRRPVEASTYAVQRIGFKFLPVCFSLHPVVYAVRALRKRSGATAIDRIVVTGPATFANFMSESPPNALAQRFNLRYALAEEIVHGLAPGKTLHLADPQVRDLAARIFFVPAASGSTVSIWHDDGTQLQSEVPQQAPSPAEAHLEDALHEKFLACTEPRKRRDDAERLWAYLMAIEQAEHLNLRQAA